MLSSVQAKSEYEREERRREKRKAAGEDTWMLPSVSDRIADEDEDEHRKVLLLIYI